MIQWQWLEEVVPENDQLNSIHEALVERWKLIPEAMVHFACAWDHLEDRQTIAYLAETAEQAGKSVELMDMQEIGFSEDGRFTDSAERPIDKLFKLYPWEWMAQEPFFAEIGPGALAVHRAGMEDDAFQQGPAADPVGAQSRASACCCRPI